MQQGRVRGRPHLSWLYGTVDLYGEQLLLELLAVGRVVLIRLTVDPNCNGMGWIGGMGWDEMGWAGMGWVGWAGKSWVGLGWVGLGWAGLG